MPTKSQQILVFPIPSLSFRSIAVSRVLQKVWLSRQRKRHHEVTLLGAELAVTSRGDHQELLAFHAVGHRRSLPARGKLVPPHFFAGVRIERAKKIVHRGGTEDQATCRCQRSAK